MIKNLPKLLSLPILGKFLSSVIPAAPKMVRYFPNPYEDYTPSAAVDLNRDEIINHLNEHVRNITSRFQPTRKNVEGGIYVGVTGVAYMFYYLSKIPALSDYKNEYLEKGLEYLKPALETNAGDKTSFLLGDAGTLALATVLSHATGDTKFTDSLAHYKALYNQYLSPRFLKCGGDEFFVGRAGYLSGALWISRELEQRVFTNEELYRLCDVMVASGKDYSKKHKSPSPLAYHYYNTEYLGAAHGMSYILQMLLTVPGYLEYNTSAAKDIKASVEYIESIQTEDGNWPSCMEEVGLTDHKLVHWCHGAPGTIYLMAKAYLVYKDPKYLNACVRAGELVWEKGLLRKGPGICHGVAGNGYVFLLLHRLTGEEKYLYRAKNFADFMNTEEFLRNARLPDSPESLYEGTAGAVCYLADLLQPQKAEFPFQDVFSTY